MNVSFSDRVRKILFLARDDAMRLGHDHVGSEHILSGVLRESRGTAGRVLDRLGVNPEELLEALEAAVTLGESDVALGELPYSGPAKRALEVAVGEARESRHGEVGSAHLLLELARLESGIVADVLASCEVTFERALAAAEAALRSDAG